MHRYLSMPRIVAAFAVDDGEQSEFGDVEAHAIVADTSDFSPHQCIAPDEACGAMGSDDNEQCCPFDAARFSTVKTFRVSTEAYYV